MGAPTGSYIAGQSAVVSLLKNVDHYQMNANFSIYLWDGKGVNSTLVGYYPDTTAPSMTVYQVRSPGLGPLRLLTVPYDDKQIRTSRGPHVVLC